MPRFQLEPFAMPRPELDGGSTFVMHLSVVLNISILLWHNIVVYQNNIANISVIKIWTLKLNFYQLFYNKEENCIIMNNEFQY